MEKFDTVIKNGKVVTPEGIVLCGGGDILNNSVSYGSIHLVFLGTTPDEELVQNRLLGKPWVQSDLVCNAEKRGKK